MDSHTLLQDCGSVSETGPAPMHACMHACIWWCRLKAMVTHHRINSLRKGRASPPGDVNSIMPRRGCLGCLANTTPFVGILRPVMCLPRGRYGAHWRQMSSRLNSVANCWASTATTTLQLHLFAPWLAARNAAQTATATWYLQTIPYSWYQHISATAMACCAPYTPHSYV
jgi:hypothetical protein